MMPVHDNWLHAQDSITAYDASVHLSSDDSIIALISLSIFKAKYDDASTDKKQLDNIVASHYEDSILGPLRTSQTTFFLH